MKIKSKITALVTVILMLLMQVPLSAFAAETTNTLTPDTLENGAEDISYSATFDYSGSAYIDEVWITDSNLPVGEITLNSPSWTWFSISGTPKTQGTYSFTVNVKNKNGEVLSKDYTLTIERDLPLEISTDHLDRGYVGSEYSYNVRLTHNRTNGNKWKLEDADGNDLPEGLKIDEDTGDILWQSPAAGKYNLKITVTRKEKTISKTLKLIIEPEGGCKHNNPQKTAGQTATCQQNGTRDYWYCDDCERYFYDAGCTGYGSEYLGKIYTIGFHSDEEDNNGKCDTCGKTMPIFTKVTSEEEITSCGMYLVVSKIGDKYYTFKIPEGSGEESIGATEITQNSDGTFNYPKKDNGVMILKTEFAAECNELDAGKPRYAFVTTINGVPYSVSGADSSYSLMLYEYGNGKYGYRMALPKDGTPKIASVYSEYWGTGTTEDVLTAFEGKKDDATKLFFAFRNKEFYEEYGVSGDEGNYKYDELETYPIELYKLTYKGEASEQKYTLYDTQSVVTMNTGVTVLDDYKSGSCSTVGGIGEAVTTSFVESVITNQDVISGDVLVTTYADINLKSEGTTADEGGYVTINSLVYEITPKIELKTESSETTYTEEIDDDSLDGSEITLTLCVGNMNPSQIIHHKKDGTKEYFYKENSKGLQAGQKTFSFDNGNYGNFVTFTVDSFSDIQILASCTNTAVSGKTFTVNGNNIYGNTVILALYNKDNQMVECQTAVYDGNAKTFTATATDYTSAKVMVWDSLSSIKPVTEAENVNLKQND